MRCIICGEEYESKEPRPWTCDKEVCRRTFLGIPDLVRHLLAALLSKCNLNPQQAIELLEDTSKFELEEVTEIPEPDPNFKYRKFQGTLEIVGKDCRYCGRNCWFLERKYLECMECGACIEDNPGYGFHYLCPPPPQSPYYSPEN